jgi:uncharacterized protein (UPF0333 family)
MAISRLWVGAFANGIGTTLTPATGGSYQANDSLIEVTGELMGTQTITDPSGYVRVSANNNAKQTVALLHTAASGSETIPGITWGTGSIAWSVLLAYRGLAAQASVLDATQDRVANTTSGNLFGPASATTPNQPNSLVLFVAQMNKTAVTNGNTFTPPSGFTIIAQQVLSGNKTAVVICEQIQSTIQAIPANTVISGSVNETSAQTHQGVIIVLKPSVASFAPYPRPIPFTVYDTDDTFD